MEFVESDIFAKQVHSHLSDDDYRDLQGFLAGNPKAGKLIPGGHGLRKIRWASSFLGRGKRGGVRVIYYCISAARIHMVSLYAKNELENIDRGQIKALAMYVRKEFQ